MLFKNFTQMDATTVERLVVIFSPKIARKHTNYPKTICMKTRLMITLRFLSTFFEYRSS